MVNLLRAFFPSSPPASFVLATAPRETLRRHRSSFPLFLISDPVRSLLLLLLLLFLLNTGCAKSSRVRNLRFRRFSLGENSERDARRRIHSNFRLILTFQRENVSIGVPDDRKLLTTNKHENVQDAREDED